MGQITNAGAKGITVLPTERETGPGAGSGNTGNNTLLLGLGAGQNNTAANTVILGAGSGGGGIPNTNPGNTIVGEGSLNVWNATGGFTPAGITSIGQGNGAALTMGDSLVMIGQNVLPNFVSSIDSSIFIGNSAGLMRRFTRCALPAPKPVEPRFT